jgi:hypothetical protein
VQRVRGSGEEKVRAGGTHCTGLGRTVGAHLVATRGPGSEN